MDSNRIRSCGPGKVLLYIEADNPAVKKLKASALFVATYSRAGRVIAYDFAFPATEAQRLKKLAGNPEPGYYRRLILPGARG